MLDCSLALRYATPMTYSEFQDALRTAIRAQRGAQAEIARRLGISTPSVAAYVTGGNRIPAEHLDVILDVLGLALDLQGQVRSGDLTPETLTQVDPLLGISAMSADLQHVRRMTPRDLAAQVLTTRPDGYERLPGDARHHLDVARACIAYAGFYSPLFLAATAQLMMAAEAGIRGLARQHGLTVGTSGMAALIRQLEARGHLSAGQAERWRAWSKNRNLVQHPGDVRGVSIGIVLPLLYSLTADLLDLFP